MTQLAFDAPDAAEILEQLAPPAIDALPWRLRDVAWSSRSLDGRARCSGA